MKIILNILALALSSAFLLPSCSESGEGIADPRAIKFSTDGDLPTGFISSRASSASLFGAGGKIGVFACYRPQDSDRSEFVSDFMRNQPITFDGSLWSYSPIKYWPTNGSVEFKAYYPYNSSFDNSTNASLKVNHRTTTGLEPLYSAHTEIKAENGKLSGDGIGENGNLQLRFSPLINIINFTAEAKDGLFDEVDGDEYKDCRFLIRNFRIWGFFSRAVCDMDNASWSRQLIPFTRTKPLDMTQALASGKTEETVPGYKYNPAEGYCTDRAVVIVEGARQLNIFGQPAYFIPMNGVIPGNEPGFEIEYVVLTNKHGETTYKESGIVTRTGSLSEIFENNNGLIRKIINVNLQFTVDGVTVTRNLEDYIYKPMF